MAWFLMSASLARGEISPDPKSERALQLEGLRPGMSKAQSLGLLKTAMPSSKVEEWYTGLGWADRRPLAEIRPADQYLFSELRAEEKPCPFGRPSKKPQRLLRLLFTADVLDPKLALILEEVRFCAETAAKPVVQGFLAQFPGTPTRTLRVDLEHQRLSGIENTAEGGAFEGRFHRRQDIVIAAMQIYDRFDVFVD